MSDVEERMLKQADLQEAYALGVAEGKQQRHVQEVRQVAAQLPRLPMQIDIKHIGCVKLSELIAAWDTLHKKDTGDIGFCDLDAALSAAGVVVVNDIEGVEPPEEPQDG